MAEIILDNDFSQEKKCTYKDELYAVRDNGAVLRYPRHNNRTRPTDNKWTFGKPNDKTGYMNIASVPIHRIVATAFHGEPETKELVVDHIDTNRKNNRPENLRWVTRLENILLNPITAKRIAYICGSVENFLANPSKFRDKFDNPDYQWMATVSIEEALTSLQRMQEWANSDKKSSDNNSLDKWIFNRDITEKKAPTTDSYYIQSKTPNAVQRIFTPYDKPNEFPSTPQVIEDKPLTTYYKVLNEGSVFFRNHNGEYVVVKRKFSKDKNTLYVLTKSAYVWKEQGEEHIPVPISELPKEDYYGDLPHSLTQITFKNGLFIHEKMEMGFHPTEELEEMFTEYTAE